jgi:hypothetical protein
MVAQKPGGSLRPLSFFGHAVGDCAAASPCAFAKEQPALQAPSTAMTNQRFLSRREKTMGKPPKFLLCREINKRGLGLNVTSVTVETRITALPQISDEMSRAMARHRGALFR